jgi:hypothetical protein
MKKILWITIVLFLLSSCSFAKPLGQYKPSELNRKEKVIAAKYDEVYFRLSEGFRKWGEAIIEGTLYAERKTGHFDIYAHGFLGSRVGVAIIDLKQLDDGSTRVFVGAWNAAAYYRRAKEWNGIMWIEFAEGNYSSIQLWDEIRKE